MRKEANCDGQLREERAHDRTAILVSIAEGCVVVGHRTQPPVVGYVSESLDCGVPAGCTHMELPMQPAAAQHGMP